MKKIRFTKGGFAKIKQEYADLLKSRPEAVAHLKKAREMGDLSENGYYKASRAKLSSIDHRLMVLKFSIKQASIIENSPTGAAAIGSNVKLSDGEKEYSYTIVGDLEANPSEGKISLLSPLGRSIEGKKIGEVVELTTPRGTVRYTIKEIN